MDSIFEKSLKSGLNGASAMTVNVFTLLWMRTIERVYQKSYLGLSKYDF
jgi:hypothetical protein